jgi:hypothetical protein
MAFTSANLESVKHSSKYLNEVRGDDWKSLIDDKIRQDEVSMTQEMIAQKKKKEAYKDGLDNQSKYLSSLKQNKQRLHEENDKAERLWLTDKYNQENDLMKGQRMRSMGKLRQINDQNKYNYDIQNRKQSLERTGDGYFGENPIELRFRTDLINKLEKNKVRERDISDYNDNAVRMVKQRRELRKEKDKYQAEQFNQFVEKQAVTHKINRASQQDKYETKRQAQDLMHLRRRSILVKKTIDDLIAQYKDVNNQDTDEMQELIDMQSTIKKCVIDVEKAEQMHPNSLDSFAKDVHSKTNVILDWQRHNKKITAIEDKLKEKEHYKFIRSQADAEINEMNRDYAMKKERQNKYLGELQEQERHQKHRDSNLKYNMSEREKMINKRPSAGQNSYYNDQDSRRNSNVSQKSREGLYTIDVDQHKYKQTDRVNSYYDPLKMPTNAYGT